MAEKDRGRGMRRRGVRREKQRNTERENGELLTKQVRAKENHSNDASVATAVTALTHRALTTCQVRCYVRCT